MVKVSVDIGYLSTHHREHLHRNGMFLYHTFFFQTPISQNSLRDADLRNPFPRIIIIQNSYVYIYIYIYIYTSRLEIQILPNYSLLPAFQAFIYLQLNICIQVSYTPIPPKIYWEPTSSTRRRNWEPTRDHSRHSLHHITVKDHTSWVNKNALSSYVDAESSDV